MLNTSSLITFGILITTAIFSIGCASNTSDKTVKQTGFNIQQKSDISSMSYITTTAQLKSNYIPDSVFQMANLRHLSIQGMDCDYREIDENGNDITKCWMISEISPKIKNLRQLETLQLNVNAIVKIPNELIELKNLKSLVLDDNIALSDIDIIAKLESLETVSLNGCNLIKMPSNIGKLKKLKSLGLAGNKISKIEKERIKKALPNCNTYY